MITYLSTVEVLNENIINPFRSGTVKIATGSVSVNGIRQAYIMIDNLSWMFKLKPSFVMIFPKVFDLSKDGGATNTSIYYPKYAAQKMEFNKENEGTASLRTYFLGHSKDNRTFDIYYRFFETGFKLSNFKNLENTNLKLNGNTELNISSKDYKHPTMITGDTKKFKVQARIKRKN